MAFSSCISLCLSVYFIQICLRAFHNSDIHFIAGSLSQAIVLSFSSCLGPVSLHILSQCMELTKNLGLKWLLKWAVVEAFTLSAEVGPHLHQLGNCSILRQFLTKNLVKIFSGFHIRWCMNLWALIVLILINIPIPRRALHIPRNALPDSFPKIVLD